MERDTRNLAVFIDFENCAKAPAFDLKILMARLKERGRLLIRRAYGDWGRFAAHKRALAEASVSLIELPSHGSKGKNSSDIALVVDALEATMNRPHIDTLVVVSGDSDYTPLFSKVRELGKYVIVVGPQNGTSSFVKDYCDELLYFSALAGTNATDKVATKGSYPLLEAALRATLEEGREPRLSTIKNRMKQMDSSFDEGNYGFSKFSKYLARAERDGIIGIVRTATGEWIVTDTDDNELTGDPLPPADDRPGQPISPPEASTQRSSPPVNQLLAALRKHHMVHLGPPDQRVTIARMVELASRLSYPAPHREVCDTLLASFAPEISAGTLSKTKVRGLLRLLVHAGVFSTSRTQQGEDSHQELVLATPISDPQEAMRVHDRHLIALAKDLEIELDVEAWTPLMISASWPSLLGR